MTESDKTPTKSRRETAILIALLLVIAAFRFATIRDGQPWGGDFAQYLQHARNIAEGDPYAETGYIYNPHWPDIGPPRYPPGLPLLLSPFYAGPEEGLGDVKLLTNLLSWLACVVAAFVFAARAPLWARFGLTAFLGFSLPLWEAKDHIISEHVFAPLFLVALAACAKVMNHHRLREVNITRALLTGLVIYLAYSTRSVALLLVPSLGLAALLTTKRLGTTVLVAGTTAFLLAVLQGVLLPSGVGYLDQLDATLRHVADNVVVYTRGFSYYFGSTSLRFAAAVPIAAFAALGYVRRLREGRIEVTEAFFVFYALILLSWRAAQGTRFVAPLIPLVFMWAGEAIARLERGKQRLIIAALGVVMTVALADSYKSVDFDRIPGGLSTPGLEETFDFIREQTPADAVFLFRKPRVLAHYCDRRAATLHDGPQEEQLEFARSIDADYIVSRLGDDEEWVQVFMQRNDERTERVFRSGAMEIHRFTAD